MYCCLCQSYIRFFSLVEEHYPSMYVFQLKLQTSLDQLEVEETLHIECFQVLDMTTSLVDSVLGCILVQELGCRIKWHLLLICHFCCCGWYLLLARKVDINIFMLEHEVQWYSQFWRQNILKFDILKLQICNLSLARDTRLEIWILLAICIFRALAFVCLCPKKILWCSSIAIWLLNALVI